MILLFFIALISSLIIYQDFKQRKINLLLTLFLILLILVFYYLQNKGVQILYNLLFCLMYYLLCFITLKFYFYLKDKRSPMLIDQMIGWGDIVLLFAIGSTLEPEFMISFFAFSFILALLIHLIVFSKSKSIPLAAYMLLFYNSYLIYLFI